MPWAVKPRLPREKIIERDADYVLALKENQRKLYEDVAQLFANLEDSHYKAYAFDYDKTVNKRSWAD